MYVATCSRRKQRKRIRKDLHFTIAVQWKYRDKSEYWTSLQNKVKRANTCRCNNCGSTGTRHSRSSWVTVNSLGERNYSTLKRGPFPLRKMMYEQNWFRLREKHIDTPADLNRETMNVSTSLPEPTETVIL